ncbi:unnamed protein product [Adineta steineri]|uniref:VWA7 N-terminal domain-containing protein n=1 Tax=Adineta steineri TaxID=433720 RepID=A0A814QWS8_9BILA|nr:unnamed protein product [Adineta steineri]CAF3635297.1 unnamed protein product [Adineta steineri]
MILLIFFLFNYFSIINGFNPISLSSDSPSATHESITRCAFATITSEYIQTQFQINITIPTITNGTCPSSFFIQLKSIFPQIQKQGGNSYSTWINTIDYIIGFNALVDVVEQTDESRHFDSESFIAASQIILARYKTAIDSLNSSDYDNSNEYFGKVTHTLQDFYSHSNWIELNNREPQQDLGINNMTSAQFAAPTVRTCTNCSTGTNAICPSNNCTLAGLTSGYFKLLTDIIHKKPVGKCSHGGTFDATKNNDAIGGINKDTVDSIHGFLHVPAAQTAYLATYKILLQFRSQVLDTLFGKFINILDRKTVSSKILMLVSSSSSKSQQDSSLVYTNILNDIRKTNMFSSIQEMVSSPARDSYYKSHILSIATHKHIGIDILRNSMYRQNSYDYGQDLARITGGLYLYNYNKSQDNINVNQNKQTELINLLYSKDSSSDNILINVDNTCSDLILEFLTNDTISSLTIQLQKWSLVLSPSNILTNTTYYRSYIFSNILPGQWRLIISSLPIKFTFDLRVSCYSKFRCFSRVYVNNDNVIHPGLIEFEGNLIQNQNALLITTCDDNSINITDISVAMADEINGNILGNSFQSIYNSENDRWITNLTNIPSNPFRFKFSFNNQQIQRLSYLLYQPSLIDVEITQVNTTSKQNILINYRIHNYNKKSVKINFIVKNIGTYMTTKDYKLKANATQDDYIDLKSEANQKDMIVLTITTSTGDWNYDVYSL